MSGRFARTTREAFACERYPAMSGPYRRPPMWRAVIGFVCFFAVIALLGVIAAWRG